MRPIYLSPGPSQLYPTVEAHVQEALRLRIPSISHRSPEFMDFYASAVSGLKRLFNAPDDYEVFFFSSATEIWERLAQNAVRNASYHLINGDFSNRFQETVAAYGKTAYRHEVPFGQGFPAQGITAPIDAELIAAIANETSSGVWTPPEAIIDLAERHPGQLVVVDAVSCAPLYPIDLQKIDGIYFSVQKCFGLPAGLGVLMAGPVLLKRALDHDQQGLPVGSYHSFTNMLAYARKNQVPETPNVLGIYLLSRVVQDLLQGWEAIQAESKAKAKLLYDFFDAHPRLKPFVSNPRWRSETVVVVKGGESAAQARALLAQQGFLVGEGYGKFKQSQFRVANFPAVGIEDMKRMIGVLEKSGV